MFKSLFFFYRYVSYLLLFWDMPIRVGIIGGGIGGLALAVALSSLHIGADLIEIDIYESASELTQTGAGITFWPRTWNILDKIGLTPELTTHLAPGQHIPDGTGPPRLGFHFRKADQAEGVPIHDLIFAGTPLSFHRSVVQGALLKHISKSTEIHLSKRLINYAENTSSSHGGADGIKSTVRKQLISYNPKASGIDSNGHKYSESDPVWSGTFAYRCAVDSSVLQIKMPLHRALTTHVVYCGKNKHVVAYPILQGRVVNVAAYVSDLSKDGSQYGGPSFEDVSTEELIPLFESWEEEVRVLLESAENPSRWAIHAVHPLQSYVSRSGQIVLLGDAAHAMTPHQGNGAGQAIEDAYILAHLITQGINSSVSMSTITNVYDSVRRPAANLVHHLSRMQGLFYEFNASDVAQAETIEEGETWSPSRLRCLGESIVRDWRYAWETTADSDQERALELLRQAALEYQENANG